MKIGIQSDLVKNICVPKIYFLSFSNDDDYKIPTVDAQTQTDDILLPPTPIQNQTQPPNPTPSKRGRPKKPLEECAASAKRAKLDPLLDFLKESAREVGSSLENLLFFFGRRHAYQSGKFDEAKFYEDLLEHGIDTNFKKITPEKAFYLK